MFKLFYDDAQGIPDLGDVCDLPVVAVWLAGWGRGENGQDMTFEWDVIVVREYYEIFGKSGNKFLTNKFLRHCVCKGIS